MKLIMNILLLLIIINFIYPKNLFCPNTPLNSLHMPKSQNLVSFLSDNEKEIVSRVTPLNRTKYEDVIDLKNKLSSSFNVYPDFSPEKEAYKSGLNNAILLCFLFSLLPICIIIAYVVLRFFYNRCTGPKKPAEISRFYRNLTVLLIIISFGGMVILFIIILANSNAVFADVDKTFNATNISFDYIDRYRSKLIELNDSFMEYVENVENVDQNLTSFDQIKELGELITNSNTSIGTYKNGTTEKTKQFREEDLSRNIFIILLFCFHLIILVLSFVFYFFRFQLAEGVLFFIFLVDLPLMIIFEGYLLKFFFKYSDLCSSVHGVLYENEIPVAGKSIGYYYNCFDRKLKAQLYEIRYILYNAYNTLNSPNNDLKALYDNYTESFNIFSNCDLIKDRIPKIEEDFCVNNLSRMKSIIMYMIYLLLCIFFAAICFRRMELLIWKKKAEIEEMIDNLEQLY